MRMKLIPLIAAVGAIALALALVSTSQAGKSGVLDTDHNLAAPGVATCEHCHLPHKAKDFYLWALDPDPDYSGDSVVLPLCYSCHDNTVANGAYIPNAEHNHPQGVVMYEPSTGEPYPITEHASYESSCKKCMEPDCGKCHDSHSDTWVFLDSERFDADTIYPPTDYDGDTVPEDFQNASVCAWCHEGKRHGIDSYDEAGNPIPHTTHPEMISQPEGADDFVPPASADRRWWPDATPSDFEGTRLWTDDTVYANHPGDDTQYYVASSGAGDIRCMTCHTTHAGEEEELETMPYLETEDPTTDSKICINCHE